MIFMEARKYIVFVTEKCYSYFMKREAGFKGSLPQQNSH
jgi:hypothetical protein